MVFSRLEFIFLFLTTTLFLYFIIPYKYLWLRNVVLFVVSLIFYGWGEPVYVFVMIFSILVSYICGYFLGKYKEKDNRKAKRYLIISIVVNLALLGFFKYTDFVLDNLRLIPALSGLPRLNITLPIGISFYTFQIMSYTIDVYRGDATAQKSIINFGTYVTLFPQLVAGPIVRYHDIDLQLGKRKHEFENFSTGIRRFICGLGKKVLLANTAGELWKSLAEAPKANGTVVGAWFGIILFAFQIYFDFSGYSDMAIGLGKMFGFDFLENFNYPYISKSITEFWRRWHISLSTWFREYVYIPLGGNRKGRLKTYRNLLIVWFLTGFWHGASWNYVLWGLYFFVFLVIEKLFLLKFLEKIPKFFSHFYTLLVVLLSWVLFVFEDISAGFVWLKNMFGAGGVSLINGEIIYDIVRNLPFIVILIFAATPLPNILYKKLRERSTVMYGALDAVSVLVFLLCISYLVNSSYNPFLYFRF